VIDPDVPHSQVFANRRHGAGTGFGLGGEMLDQARHRRIVPLRERHRQCQPIQRAAAAEALGDVPARGTIGPGFLDVIGDRMEDGAGYCRPLDDFADGPLLLEELAHVVEALARIVERTGRRTVAEGDLVAKEAADVPLGVAAPPAAVAHLTAGPGLRHERPELVAELHALEH
jgi:hypothetical protein